MLSRIDCLRGTNTLPNAAEWMLLMSRVAAIRVLPELRAVQVAQERLMVPAETWYFALNYDMEGTQIPEWFVRVGKAQAVWRIFKTRAETLEVPEPLWVRFLPTNLLIVVAWRLSGFARFRKRRARTYAIENNDVVAAVFGSRLPPAPLQRLTMIGIGAMIRLFYERIVFGTPGALAAYRQLPFLGGVDTSVILGVPTPVRTGSSPQSEPMSAIFVGQLEPRKGVRPLMEAWPLVEVEEPSARLVVVGTGPMSAEVVNWVAERPASRSYLGQIPYQGVHEVIASSSVIIAPSQRSGRWREQIGLPIEEGLSLGLTIVSTSETGLADWLAEHGHHVVDPSADAATLAAEIASALRAPLEQSDVLTSLATEHARIAADRWLHQEKM
jgi:glycosyltransferase involved in cell wall biosynthesis